MLRFFVFPAEHPATTVKAAIHIALAESDALVARCYEVMHELRPHLSDAGEFTARVNRQAGQGYRLAFAECGGEVQGVAGFRISEHLAWGRILYVDDLVTSEKSRGTGCGSALIDFLVAHAREQKCAQFHLDSGVQRFDAHRFYLHKGMDITCHHFALKLS